MGGRKQLERFIEPDTHSLTSDLQGTSGILGERYVISLSILENFDFLKFLTLRYNLLGYVKSYKVLESFYFMKVYKKKAVLEKFYLRITMLL